MELLTDKHVIVTGGASGLGREMVLGLLGKGALVFVVDKSNDLIINLQSELEQKKYKNFRTLASDLSERGCGEKILDFATKEFGNVFGLVNNAGIGRSVIKDDIFLNPPRFWEMTELMWENFLSINASAAFRTMRTIVPHMIENGQGRVINVTTSLDSMLISGSAGYGASKAAMESISAIASDDLKGTGVNVNVLIPGGPVDTPMIPKSSPYRRDSLLKPDCMVSPLLWLLTEEAKEISALRIQAHLWDNQIPPLEALKKSSAPIAWKALSGEMRKPI